MLGLLYKDFVVMKKDLLLCTIGVLGFSVPLFVPWGKMLEANGIATELINEETMTYAIAPCLHTYVCISLFPQCSPGFLPMMSGKCGVPISRRPRKAETVRYYPSIM